MPPATLSPAVSDANDPSTQATTNPHTAPLGDPALSPRLTLRWALKRTAMGIVILVTFVSGIAWLMHATIEPPAQDENTGATLALPLAPASLAKTPEKSQPDTRHAAPKTAPGPTPEATPDAPRQAPPITPVAL